MYSVSEEEGYFFNDLFHSFVRIDEAIVNYQKASPSPMIQEKKKKDKKHEWTRKYKEAKERKNVLCAWEWVRGRKNYYW